MNERMRSGRLVTFLVIRQRAMRSSRVYHLTAEMTQHGAEKDGDLDIGEVLVGMQVQIEADPAVLGTDGDGRNRRDLDALVAVPDGRA